MSRLLISFLSSVSFLVAATASAQSTETPVVGQGDSKARKVCKSEPVVGSRFAKKICHTPAEWLAIQQRDRLATEQYQRDPCRGGAASVGGTIQC